MYILRRLEYLGISTVLFFAIVLLHFIFSSTEVLNFKVYLFKGKISNIVSLMLLLAVIIRNRTFYLSKEILIAFCLILFSLILSTIFSYHLFRSVGYIFAYILEVFLYFSLTFNLCLTFDTKKILSYYFFAFKFIGFYALMQLIFSVFGIYIFNVTQFIGKLARPGAFCYEPSYYALFLVPYVGITGFLYCFDHSKKYGKQFLWACILYLLSTSTGCFFGFLGLFFLLIFFKRMYANKVHAQFFWEKIRKISYISSSFFFIVLFYFRELFVNYFFKFFFIGLAHSSFMIRLENSMLGIEAFLKSPIWGVGLGGIGALNYCLKSGLDLSSTLNLPLNKIEMFDSYNVTTDILGSLGIIGFSAFLYFLKVIYNRFKSTFDSKEVDSSEKCLSLALMGSLILMLFVMQFNPGIFRNYVWIHLGLCYGIFYKLGLKKTSKIRRIYY